MIKFFRNIRHNMLNTNRGTKYLLYAMGEIILVVIGILIALKINNWNENQKARQQEFVYLENLKEDLVDQIQMLDIYIDYEDIIIQQSNDIIRHFEENDGFYNMDTIFPKMHDLTTRWTFSNVNNTLKQLLNSNQINIIQNRNLKEALIGFNQQIELFAGNTNINNTNLVDNLSTGKFVELGALASSGLSKTMVEKFNDFYPFEVNTISNSEIAKISIELMNKSANKLELINKIVYRNTISTLQRSGNTGVRTEAERVLDLIENEIQSHSN